MGQNGNETQRHHSSSQRILKNFQNITKSTTYHVIFFLTNPAQCVSFNYKLRKEEVDMVFEIKNKAGETVATEGDFGNAAELEMVMSEMNPEESFTIVGPIKVEND